MLTVTPQEVPELIPGAPQPEPGHMDLAALWLGGELLRRRVAAESLTGPALLAARTALAAKALGLKAGVDGALSLQVSAGSGAARVIESVEVPDEIKVKYRAAQRADEALLLASGQWEEVALAYLLLAAGSGSGVRVFAGVAR
ncbi:hypothetical protein WDJ50_18650 (plasmid) [Deinococcus sp. VB142]|uniref:Uncharacterized protein n=1 Tax=Deinococcus sp. VB142 TaxID=3112952 RepID=A0AAU6Q8C2_9DEIO